MLLPAEWVPVLCESGRLPQRGASIRHLHGTMLDGARCLRVRCRSAEAVRRRWWRRRRRRSAGWWRLSRKQWRGKVISIAQHTSVTPPTLVRPVVMPVLAEWLLLDLFMRPGWQLSICCGLRLRVQSPLPHAHSLQAQHI